jgi:hypothetical protein
MNPKEAIFERMIIVLPYKSTEHVQRIHTELDRINCEGLGLDNPLYLSTKELTEEEKGNKLLDFLGGFEIIDKEMRLFVIEGLGGKGNGMD